MADAKIPPHPARTLAIFLVLAGLVLVAAAAASVAGAVILPTGTAWGAGLGAVFLWVGVRVLREGPTSQRVNMALDRLNRGLYEEAEAILDAIPPGRRTNQLRRAIDMQRSMIAFRRKDIDGAIAHATRAIEGRPSLLSRAQEQLQIVSARSLRAVAEAARDDAQGARADADAVRASPLATPGTLARASLADAITLSRTHQTEALGALLRRDRKLLLEFTTPRDRALVRALQRTLHLPAGSAYRHAAREEPRSESELASWISNLAPAARGLESVRGEATARAADLPAETNVAVPRAALAKARGQGRLHGRVVTLWALLMLVFLGVWQFLGSATPTQGAHPVHAQAQEGPGLPLPYLWLMLFFAFLGAMTFINRRGLKKITAATRLLALDDLGPAERALGAIARGRTRAYAPQACSYLVSIATRRARFADALALVDQAIRGCARNAALAQLLLPLMLGQRSYLLAALDRGDEALAELAALSAAHPTYAQLGTTQLLTRMMVAVRRGDVAGAASIASQRAPDLDIGVRDELLADALLASTEPKPAKAEVERLRGELSEDAEGRAWLAAVWPEGERALDEARARAA